MWLQIWAGFSPGVSLAPCCLGGSLGVAGSSRTHHGTMILHTTGGVRATVLNKLKELNGGVQEETSSDGAGISRATMEPVRVQLV